MSTSRIYLCAVPHDVWEQPAATHGKQADIARLVTDALSCEQRIAKEVNLENEYSHYTLCCQRIEQEVAASRRLSTFKTIDEFNTVLRSGRFPLFQIGDDYLNALEGILDQPAPARIGASFFPPDKLAEHRMMFAQWSAQQGVSASPSVQHRLAFLRLTESVGCGIVELQSSFHPETVGDATRVKPQAKANSEEEERYITLPEFSREGLVVESFDDTKHKLAARLQRQIRAALATDEPVVFGNEAQHDVITEILHEFVFVPPGEAVHPLDMRVVYVDGSEATPFPVFSLTAMLHDGTKPAIAPLRVALMSMRHLELDPEIDFCWFRNRDVSRTRTLAETDRFCFDTTLSQLRDSLALGDLEIHLYHTGFEPAVLGFYRGLAQVLRELRIQQSPRRLVVIPFYYRGGTKQAGTIWQ